MDEIDGQRDQDGNVQGLGNTEPFRTSTDSQGLAAKPLIDQDDGALYDPRKKGHLERIHHQAIRAGYFPVAPSVKGVRRGVAADFICDCGSEFHSVELRGLVAGLVTELPVDRSGSST